MGLAAVSGQLIGGALIQADIAGPRLAQLLSDQRADRPGRGDRWRRGSCPSRAPSRAAGSTSLGTVLLTVGLTAMVLPLVEGRQHGWPLWTWLSLGVAPVILIGFAAHQRRLAAAAAAQPLLAPALFASGRSAAGLLTQLAFWSGQASFFLVLALYLQQGRGLSALDGRPRVHDPRGRLRRRVRAGAGADRRATGAVCWRSGALVLAAGHGLLLGAVADRRRRRLGARAGARAAAGRRRDGSADRRR